MSPADQLAALAPDARDAVPAPQDAQVKARGLVGSVMAMARPRRPVAEREAVRAAAAELSGSNAHRARRLAMRVARLAMREIDGDAGDRVLLLLRTLDASPAELLATDPEIDTGSAICAERVRRLEAAGGRRSSPGAWEAEDREVLRIVGNKLAKRYARHLVGFQP